MKKRYMSLSKRIVAFLCCLMLLLCVFTPISVNAEAKKDIRRYSVLILDTSGSMDGTPMQKQKEAAIKFCESVLKTEGENKVALVELNSTASKVSDFIDDIDVLETKINNMRSYGGTNITHALNIAENLLDEIEDGDNIIKNVVLCTDGLPQSGKTSYTGPYTASDYTAYMYANVVYNTAAEMKNKCSLYTLGFFHSLNESYLTFARRFMKDLQNAGYYEVLDPNDLQFTFGDIAEDINNGGAKTFTYDNGYSAVCYYKDDYFKGDAYEYDPSLATMSLSFAMSAFGNGQESDYANKSSNARNLLNSIVGIDDDQIEVNDWYTVKPTTDSIGAIAGNKKIKDGDKEYTLIALAVRGGGYEREWASNFTIGKSGQHEGFDTAKSNVLEFLKSYISHKNITGPVKLWITGYSRAAATANLVSGAIDQGYKLGDSIEYSSSDVYAYCFEAPQGALKSEVDGKQSYYNIHNIINLNDPVPMVAPSALGFSRYGKDYYLPTKATMPNEYDEYLKKMLAVYQTMDNTSEYTVDNFQMKKIALQYILPGGESPIQDDLKNNYSQNVFLSQYITLISKEQLKNRNNYVSKYQDDIRYICKTYFGNDDAKTKKLTDTFIAQAKSNWPELLVYCLRPSPSLPGTDYNKKPTKIVAKWLLTAVKESGIEEYNESDVFEAGEKLADLLVSVAIAHPNYTTTAVLNGGGLGAAHYPELCFAWLASMDPNYTSAPNAKFPTGMYRIIRINCPVDIVIKDQNGTEVASIKDETPKDLGESGLISGINENGEKYVVVPADAEYQICITGREDGVVNYGISEYSPSEGDFTRIVNYFDINLGKGKTLNGIIPAYSDDELNGAANEGSSADYVLNDPNNNRIVASADYIGDDAVNAYYVVDVSLNNENAGIVVGGGISQYGSFTNLEAVENEGYVFKGWYDDKGNLLSTDKEYRLCVKKDVSLTAKFDQKVDSGNNSSSGNGGTTGGISDSGNSDSSSSSCDVMEKKSFEEINPIVILEKKEYVANGKEKKPNVTVKADGKELVSGKDYTVMYKNNVNVGTATVVVSGIGDYSGSIETKFTINPKKTSITKLYSKLKSLQLKWRKQSGDVSGYQIQYSTDKRFKKNVTKTKTIDADRTSYTIKGLKSKKKYYVRIRTYKIVDGKKYYSAWSGVKTCKTK